MFSLLFWIRQAFRKSVCMSYQLCCRPPLPFLRHRLLQAPHAPPLTPPSPNPSTPTPSLFHKHISTRGLTCLRMHSQATFSSRPSGEDNPTGTPEETSAAEPTAGSHSHSFGCWTVSRPRTFTVPPRGVCWPAVPPVNRLWFLLHQPWHSRSTGERSFPFTVRQLLWPFRPALDVLGKCRRSCNVLWCFRILQNIAEC